MKLYSDWSEENMFSCKNIAPISAFFKGGDAKAGEAFCRRFYNSGINRVNLCYDANPLQSYIYITKLLLYTHF